MAIAFNRANSNYYSASGGISLPNADWCIAVAVKVTGNSGSNRQHIFTCHTTPDPNTSGPRVFVRYHDLGHSANPGKAVAQVKDGTNAEILIISAAQLTVGDWVLGVFQRASGVKQLWVGSFGSVPTLQGSSSAALGAVTVGSGMLLDLGRESASGYYLQADMGFFAKGDFALTTEQMYAISRGLSPLQVSTRWTEYLPMQAPSTTLSATVGGRVWTQAGTPIPWNASGPFQP